MRRSVAAAGSAVFFALAPGIVAGLVPGWLVGWRMRHPEPYGIAPRVAGVALVVAGAAVILQAFVRFVVEGHGTPVPAAAPRAPGCWRDSSRPRPQPDVRRPVRPPSSVRRCCSPSPCCCGGLLVVSGSASSTFVRLYEEPVLAPQVRRRLRHLPPFNVPAWWPRLRPWRPDTRDVTH